MTGAPEVEVVLRQETADTGLTQDWQCLLCGGGLAPAGWVWGVFVYRNLQTGMEAIIPTMVDTDCLDDYTAQGPRITVDQYVKTRSAHHDQAASRRVARAMAECYGVLPKNDDDGG